MPDTEHLLREVLDEWKAGVDDHDPGRVAAVFTEDAIFQGLHPYSVGRRGVFDYYESQPVGLTVTYRINETRRPAEGVVLGYLRARLHPSGRHGDPAQPECPGHARHGRLADRPLSGVGRP